MNGKKHDVLIEEHDDRSFHVWADADKEDLIASVEGVAAVYSNRPYKTKFLVYIDPRYDMEFVKREVEAIILIGDAS